LISADHHNANAGGGLTGLHLRGGSSVRNQTEKVSSYGDILSEFDSVYRLGNVAKLVIGMMTNGGALGAQYDG
jgi:hypothetical protein